MIEHILGEKIQPEENVHFNVVLCLHLLCHICQKRKKIMMRQDFIQSFIFILPTVLPSNCYDPLSPGNWGVMRTQRD